MGNEAISPIVRMIRRVLIEWLAWLPVMIILSHSYSFTGKLLISCATISSLGLGLLLNKLTPLWSRITLIVLMGIFLGVGISLSRSDWLTFAFMGLLLWRGRYPQLTARHYGLAFVICCVMVIVAAQNKLLPDYRTILVGLSLVWIVTWFISLNRSLLNDAALKNSIATRPVRLASRKYLLVFLAGALLIFALTANFGEQLLTLPEYVPSEEREAAVPEPQPPAQVQQPSLNDVLEAEGQGRASAIWDILFWIMTGLAAVGAILFARILWRDRTWSLRRFLTAVRAWLVREKKTEELPYIEERRSLLKDRKVGQSRWNSFFQRSNREREWNHLDNPQKVRRLYEDAVIRAIEQGYGFKPQHTSSETLERLAQWRESLSLPDKDSRTSYWNRLLNIRLTLIARYEKARYSPHSVTDQEVEDLMEALKHK